MSVETRHHSGNGTEVTARKIEMQLHLRTEPSLTWPQLWLLIWIWPASICKQTSVTESDIASDLGLNQVATQSCRTVRSRRDVINMKFSPQNIISFTVYCFNLLRWRWKFSHNRSSRSWHDFLYTDIGRKMCTQVSSTQRVVWLTPIILWKKSALTSALILALPRLKIQLFAFSIIDRRRFNSVDSLQKRMQCWWAKSRLLAFIIRLWWWRRLIRRLSQRHENFW